MVKWTNTGYILSFFASSLPWNRLPETWVRHFEKFRKIQSSCDSDLCRNSAKKKTSEVVYTPLRGGGKIQTPRGPEICQNSDVPGTALHTPCSVTLTHLLDIWSNQDLINSRNWALAFPRHPTKMSLFQFACKAGLEMAFGWSDPGDQSQAPQSPAGGLGSLLVSGQRLPFPHQHQTVH